LSGGVCRLGSPDWLPGQLRNHEVGLCGRATAQDVRPGGDIRQEGRPVADPPRSPADQAQRGLDALHPAGARRADDRPVGLVTLTNCGRAPLARFPLFRRSMSPLPVRASHAPTVLQTVRPEAAIRLLTCPFFPNDHCLSRSRPSCVRTGTAALWPIHGRSWTGHWSREEADARSSRSPASSASDGMDLPQLKVQTSSLPPRHAPRSAICRYNFTDAGTLTWRVNE
jgi:hypothetical protein